MRTAKELIEKSEDSDQTGRMSGLIGDFAGRTSHFVRTVMCRLISVEKTLFLID